MNQATAISVLVGRRLRDWRKAAGLTQDDVAGKAKELGFQWEQPTVAAIELGRREVSLSEFVILPFLAQIVGSAESWNRLASFLPPERDPSESPDASTGDGPMVLDVRTHSQIQLAPACWIETEHLRSLLAGHPAGGRKIPKDALVTLRSIAEAMSVMRGEVASSFQQVAESIRKRFLTDLMDTQAAQRRTFVALHAQEADQKAARSLGVRADEVLVTSMDLWSQPLTAERNDRATKKAGPDASARSMQAIRGHVTRELMKELEEAMSSTKPEDEGSK